MFDFIQKFIYSCLALQEKVLRKKSKYPLKTSFSNKTSKKVFCAGASLELSSQTNKNKQKLQNNVSAILKKYENNPQKLLGFVQRSGTSVYRIKYAEKLLKQIGFETGFVAAADGLKALYLSLIVALFSGEKTKLSFKTEPMFILNDSEPDAFFVVQQFHKWYAMKLDLPGFDSGAQENLQKFMTGQNDSQINEMSVEEILNLKEAIARDVESINFVVNLVKTTASHDALEKILAGGASF